MAIKRTLVLDTLKDVGKEALVKGSVHLRRDHGKLLFIDLKDRTGVLQVVFPLKDLKEDTAKLASDLRSEDAIAVTGKIQKRPENMVNPELPTGSVELVASDLVIYSKAEVMPFDMGGPELNLELPTLLDYRALTLRHPKVKAIFKVQEVIIDSFRTFLKSQGFMEFQAPTVIPSIPEGGTEVFEVKYFDNKAYLSQSPQLYKQILTGAWERVFSVNKVMRAEPSVTTRHLCEYVSLDAEMGFIDSWEDVRDMAEQTIKYVLSQVEEKCARELALYKATLPEVPSKIPSLKLKDALKIVSERTGRDVSHEKDLDPEGEREICHWAKEKHGSDLVFISHYLTAKRPFYTYPDDEDPEFNQGFDLIGKGTEWLTGGRRINDYKTLLSHAEKWGADKSKIELYMQAFKYGMPPEGGFAFGAERITTQILGLRNIREASVFPRDMERVDLRFP